MDYIFVLNNPIRWIICFILNNNRWFWLFGRSYNWNISCSSINIIIITETDDWKILKIIIWSLKKKWKKLLSGGDFAFLAIGSLIIIGSSSVRLIAVSIRKRKLLISFTFRLLYKNIGRFCYRQHTCR